MGRRYYDIEGYEKLYDMIELIYILNRLSNNSYVDESSKQYLIGMLNNVESMKYNFDKYRYSDDYSTRAPIRKSGYNSLNYNNRESIADKIILLLKSLNND